MADGAPPSAPSAVQAQLVSQVQATIEERQLSMPAAAREIGVGAATLRKHLDGEHIRSDSALKYQDWLDGRRAGVRSLFLDARDPIHLQRRAARAQAAMPPAPAEERIVVDIFSGCGGLSLGFDLLRGGHFRTDLALDLEAAPIAVLNANSPKGRPVGRRADLTEFLNGTEFLVFYLEHAAQLRAASGLTAELDRLSGAALTRFRTAIAAVDAAFLDSLRTIRQSGAWAEALKGLDREALGQTSVAAFHNRLKLPRTGTVEPVLPELLWTGGDPGHTGPPAPRADLVEEARSAWSRELDALAAKRQASGPGQLGVSARRISGFIDLALAPAFEPVQAAWIVWTATRLALRNDLFADPVFAASVRDLYERSFPVSILVGGPPCQGFSRIGRGKMRSLREAQVHVHGSAAAGDARNLLFLQYVMILGALRPALFLFENVQHFKSTVHAQEGDFQATTVLEEAIRDMSEEEARYGVASRVLNASRHGVPQNRLRYFMCGVDSAVVGEEEARRLADFCLRPPEEPTIPLGVALTGLGEPALVRGESGSRSAMRERVPVGGDIPRAPSGGFEAWIRQPPPGRRRALAFTDAHAGRAAREDDASFFALLGPGRRWMDYRSDRAPTIGRLRRLIGKVSVLSDAALADLELSETRVELEELIGRLDGSLSLRLLLEQIEAGQGYPHHLIRDVYLSKQESSHGDWLARMDPDRPSKTMVSHMAKDTYAFVHPYAPRTISVREAARIQSFPDWFSFAEAALTDAFRMIGNAVPPRLSAVIAARAATVVAQADRRVNGTRAEVGPQVLESLARRKS